ncbi:MAG: acyl-coenzyme A thioesterase PaaI-like protein [Paraglaciecola sp.]|jgi:acyl-coenzyme A thioesterase PaaI-like protein
MNQPTLPVTNENVLEFYEWLFAPWVKEMGLQDISVSQGQAVAILPQNEKLQFSSGAICGQIIMSAIDTVASIAVGTSDRLSKGTVYQHTHFLRPALSENLRIEAHVLRFGKASAFLETKVTYVSSGKLVAHASLEFAF